MQPRRFSWLLLGLILATLAIGCRDGDEDEPVVEDGDPAVEIDPPETRVDVDLLSPAFEPAAFICTEDDVPPAFEYEVLDSGAVDNAEAAASEERLEQYEDWGRIDGQFAAYSSEDQAEEPTEISYFECGLERYAHISGARRAFSALSPLLEERALAALDVQGFTEITFDDIRSPQIGDQTSALTGTAVKDDQVFEFFAVTFRRLNFVGYSLSTAAEMFSFVEDAANIAAVMVRLIGETMEEVEEDNEVGE